MGVQAGISSAKRLDDIRRGRVPHILSTMSCHATTIRSNPMRKQAREKTETALLFLAIRSQEKNAALNSIYQSIVRHKFTGVGRVMAESIVLKW